jgi:hypothetical protein
MPGLAVWVNRMIQRLEEVHDGGNARLGGVGTIGIRSATIGGRAVRPAAIAILDPIVIGARLRIWILDLVHDTRIGGSRIGRELILRRYFGIAVSITKPDSISRAQHDVIDAGAATYSLMVIVAHHLRDLATLISNPTPRRRHAQFR